ncbi:MAG: hypothetical protein A2096_02270 [Spirochaetes bacterium GWF1_41_5]|nr:MAG: hypothetical protein A2096_02270 [Spirochaetes bacterium GWF1_41_5]HBE04385.1 hypothetical protein [Spirochaetia bacterium]
MNEIVFTWDEKKNTSNIIKHKISFDEAQSAFFDDMGLLFSDEEYSIIEERFILLGKNEKLKILVVCHCYQEDDSHIRIFSARKATKKENKYYWEKNYEKRI